MSRLLLAATIAALTLFANSAIDPTRAIAQSDPFLDPKRQGFPPGGRPGSSESRQEREKLEREWRERENWLRDYDRNPSKYKKVEDLETRVPNIGHLDRVQMLVAAESAALGGDGKYLIHGRLEGKAVVRRRYNDCTFVATPINAEKAWTWKICTGSSLDNREIIMRAAARAALTKQPQRISILTKGGNTVGYTDGSIKVLEVKPTRVEGTLTFLDYKQVLGGMCPRFKIIDDKRGPLNNPEDMICIEPNG